ncbi:MAG: SH3 domain-containing protein [Chloroflexota bacterium]
MRIRLCLVGLTFATALVACNSSPSLPSPPTTPSSTEPQTLPLSTVPPPTLPFQLPTYTPTFTPSIATVRPKSTLVNCRFGPGTVYTLIGELKEGQSARVTGTDINGEWYYIDDPGNPHGQCWVSADFVEVTGNINDLPIIQPPAPSVIKIELTVEPSRILVACDQFPQVVYLYADITTDGPALVTYRWEVSTGVSSVDNAIAFEGASTQTISDYYQIASPNDYWVAMHVLGPNKISETANFQVLCNP